MYLTALLMGLAGGLHCAGMCGPLALAVTARKPLLQTKLVYTLGRVFTYGILGALAGFAGSFIPIATYQNWVAFALGGTLLLTGFGVISGIKIPVVTAWIIRFSAWLKHAFGSVMQKKGNQAVFLLGMLNGLLPCGLTYLAMSYCLTLNHFTEGFIFMIFFGVGTIPLMTGLLWITGIAMNRLKLSYRRVNTLVLIVLGCLIIGRAMLDHSGHTQNHLEGKVPAGEVICR